MENVCPPCLYLKTNALVAKGHDIVSLCLLEADSDPMQLCPAEKKKLAAHFLEFRGELPTALPDQAKTHQKGSL